MSDSSWDNSGLPPERKGRGLGMKLGLGCGIVMLLFLATCAGFLGWSMKKGDEAADKVWGHIARSTQLLKSEEGARSLYRTNPGLTASYATEADFLEAASRWRPGLGSIPAQRPNLRELFKDGQGLSVTVSRSQGRERLRVRYPTPAGAVLHLEVEDDRIIELRMD